MQLSTDLSYSHQSYLSVDTSTKVDPSLQERQRQLKRARLQDSLNEQLANRPGPLELVQSNILQPLDNPELQDAIKGKYGTSRVLYRLPLNALGCLSGFVSGWLWLSSIMK